MSDIHDALMRRYQAPEWATFFEVRDDAGFRARRAADFVAMNTWPSRGLSVHGVEIKTSRADWLRELRNPAKSASVQRYCDRWWLAVSGHGIVLTEEIPEQWGLLVLDGNRLRTVKEAPQLEPEPLSKGFIAVLLRSASESTVPKATVEETINSRVKEIVESQLASFKDQLGQVSADRNRLQKGILDFEAACGVRIVQVAEWYAHLTDPTKVGAAVRAVMEGTATLESEGELSQARNLVAEALRGLDSAMESVQAIRPRSTENTPTGGTPDDNIQASPTCA